MRIITVNVNGIRAAEKKGFFEWMKQQRADVVCLQETKAQEDQLAANDYHPRGYHSYFFDAEKKGYSGVALYCRGEPDAVRTGLGWMHCDSEGRWIEADFGRLTVASLYLPSGSSSEERHLNKLNFMGKLRDEMKRMRRRKRVYIITGDFNTVHKEIDIRNFRSNRRNSGCTDEERQWMDDVLNKDGWVDAFREVEKGPDQYTWWSNRGNARANNVGWRIDYQLITPGLKGTVQKASVYKGKWFSDHAPLTIDYDLDLG